MERVCDENFENYYSSRDGHISMNHDEEVRLYELCGKVETSNNSTIPVLGSGLLKITLLQNRRGYSALLISINHSLMDARSIVDFMNCWSGLHMRKEFGYKFSFNRDLLRYPPIESFKSHENTISILDYGSNEELGGDRSVNDRGFTNPLEDDFSTAIQPEEIVTKMIQFTNQSIGELREEVRRKTKDFRFSSNDCITAFLWMVHSIIREGESTPLVLVVDLRNRIEKLKNLGVRYLGNASILVNVSPLDQKIVDLEFHEVVRLVRKLVNKVDDKVAHSAHESLDRLNKRGEKMRIWSSSDLRNALVVNDWRIFNAEKPCFGEGLECVRVVRPKLKFNIYPQVWNILTHPSCEGGVDVLCRFHRDVYKVLCNFDLTRLETIKKLKKENWKVL